MTTRAKVLLLGVGIMVLAMGAQGAYLLSELRSIHNEELVNKARVVLEIVSVPLVSSIATHEVERLDRTVGDLQERLREIADLTFVMVLDNEGHIVALSDRERYGTIPADPLVAQGIAARGFFHAYPVRNQVRHLFVSQPLESRVSSLPGLRWGTVVAELNLQHQDHKRAILVREGTVAVVLAGLLTAGIIFLVVRRQFLEPILRLTRAAQAFQIGDWTARAGVRGRGELATLGATFDDMAESLVAHTDNLQQLVHQRTTELATRNEELKVLMAQIEEANRRLADMVRTDPLTGLFNRRHLEESLAHHCTLALRSGAPLSFAMLDVDFFKNYNDTNGHPAGDEVLRILAAILQRRLRRTDIPCRYGGEEFAILLPDTPGDKALLVAEYLRKLIASTSFPFGSIQPGGTLTVSIGVSSLAGGDKAAGQLVREADEALYRAKAAGRNRVILHQDAA